MEGARRCKIKQALYKGGFSFYNGTGLLLLQDSHQAELSLAFTNKTKLHVTSSLDSDHLISGFGHLIKHTDTTCHFQKEIIILKIKNHCW